MDHLFIFCNHQYLGFTCCIQYFISESMENKGSIMVVLDAEEFLVEMVVFDAFYHSPLLEEVELRIVVF